MTDGRIPWWQGILLALILIPAAALLSAPAVALVVVMWRAVLRG